MRVKQRGLLSNYERKDMKKEGQAELASAGKRRTGSGGEDAEQ